MPASPQPTLRRSGTGAPELSRILQAGRTRSRKEVSLPASDEVRAPRPDVLADGCGGKVSRARRIGDTAMLDDRDQTAQIAYIRKKLRFRQEKP